MWQRVIKIAAFAYAKAVDQLLDRLEQHGVSRSQSARIFRAQVCIADRAECGERRRQKAGGTLASSSVHRNKP
jgi:hypothetical protein